MSTLQFKVSSGSKDIQNNKSIDGQLFDISVVFSDPRTFMKFKPIP